jgi:ADP-heptose:LPS heptosyltransferase
MELEGKEWSLEDFALKTVYRNILICPQTTNPEKDLDGELLSHTIKVLKKRYPDAQITVAAMHERYLQNDCQSFIFRKKASSSQAFIELMKESDLVVCADSAPMHLAQITDRDNVCLFFATRPELVLDAGARTRLLDLNKSDISACKNAISEIFV